jgi:hypothetical protein
MGCVCAILKNAAIVLLAIAAIAFIVHYCIVPGPLPVALTSGTAGLIVLAIWAAVCRDCEMIRTLFKIFSAIAIAALMIALAYLVFGLPNMCWIGWLSVAILLAIAAGILFGIARAIGCNVFASNV